MSVLRVSLGKLLAVPMQSTYVKGPSTASSWELKATEGPRVGRLAEGLPSS